jgi:hypothetical protein
VSDGRVELELGTPDGPIEVGWELAGLRELGLTDGGEPPWSLEGVVAPSSLLRVVSAVLEDGTAIGFAALRPAAAGGHGDEEVGAFIARDGRDPQPILDARLSTEYDAGGGVRRAGLELWVEESGPPARGAGDRESTGEVRRGGLAGEAVRLAFRLDGVPGIADYELLRPAG